MSHSNSSHCGCCSALQPENPHSTQSDRSDRSSILTKDGQNLDRWDLLFRATVLKRRKITTMGKDQGRRTDILKLDSTQCTQEKTTSCQSPHRSAPPATVERGDVQEQFQSSPNCLFVASQLSSIHS